MTHTELIEKLFQNQDLKYKTFNLSLIPGSPEDSCIGVRVPVLRQLAKDFYKTSTEEELNNFFTRLPHKYFEENHIHIMLIEHIKDLTLCINELDRFLPFIDNWAVCDGKNPKILKKNPEILMAKIKEWIHSDHVYTIRYGIESLMSNFLDDLFKPEYLDLIAELRSCEYYVNMMISWFFATALAKQWDASLKVIAEKRLDPWCHNKAIQKACESFRVTDEHKKILRGLKL